MKRCLFVCLAMLVMGWSVQAAPAPAALSSSSLPAIEKAPVAIPADNAIPRFAGSLDDGGETCAAAVAITSIPATLAGNTCSHVNDYDWACDYTGSTAPDVVYSYTPTADISLTLSLCNSYYDTKLYVYQDVCQNPPLYCNDDACSGPNYPLSYLSLLSCVDFLAGHTYYIVVDGYGQDCGDYILDIEECLPPELPECPASSIYSQTPNDPAGSWTAVNSTSNNQYVYLAYDNFAGLDVPICDIHFWGLSLVFDNGWYMCEQNQMTFVITFYPNNENNMPGPAACTYTVVLTRQATEYSYSGFPLWYWSTNLDPCCTLASGWVSIQGVDTTGSDCAFLWMSSPTGDGQSLQWVAGAIQTNPYDLSFCLTPGETPPDMDMGDIIHPLNAPNGYPTLVANPGHILTGIAWLGANITGEPAPNVFDLDPFDDGVVFPPFMIPCTPTTVTVTVTAGPNYAGQPLFLSAWKDGNDDGDFCDVLCPEATGAPAAPEWIIQDAPVTPGVWTFTFIDPGMQNVPPYTGWFRFRLCSVPVGPLGFGYGLPQQCPGTWGVDELGEVEDYWFEEYQLAVDLTSFDAVAGNGEVALSWVTASETGNDYFELTRNGLLVDRISSQGNGATGHTYRYVDGGLDNGMTYEYVLYAIDLSGTREAVGTVSATPEAPAEVITEYALHQNYPNPFNPTTHIAFDLVESGWVSLKVYNVVGQQVATVVEGNLIAGPHTVDFTATNLPSGIYWYKLTVNDFSATRKMLLVK
ncbi:MAG: T9SS type A sorting domain-containing protein [Calditrichota bacterium]